MKKPILRIPARVSYMRDAHRYAHDKGMRIIRVKKVYHRAHRGEKAFVRHTGKLLRQDAWFYGMWPMEGTVLLVSSHVGHGPHHQRPTLYVYPQDIHDDFPLTLYRRYLRWRWGLSLVLYLALVLLLLEWMVYGLFLGVKAAYGGIRQATSKGAEEDEDEKPASIDPPAGEFDSDEIQYGVISFGSETRTDDEEEWSAARCGWDAPEAGGMTIRSLSAAEFRELVQRTPPEDDSEEG